MLLYCLSICTRNVLLLRAQIIRKAKEEAAVSHQVLSSPVLPGDSLFCCFQEFLSFLYCWLLMDLPAAFFPASVPLFLGLQRGPWDPFLFVTCSIQTAPIQGVLHISPAPLTPGLFSFTEQIWRWPTAWERLYSFPHPLFFLSSVAANPQDGTHHFFPAGKEFFLSLHLFIFQSQKTQLRFESDNSIHMSSQGRLTNK